MNNHKTCDTCADNDDGLCDRTGRLVEDDDTCEMCREQWQEALMRQFLRGH